MGGGKDPLPHIAPPCVMTHVPRSPWPGSHLGALERGCWVWWGGRDLDTTIGGSLRHRPPHVLAALVCIFASFVLPVCIRSLLVVRSLLVRSSFAYRLIGLRF